MKLIIPGASGFLGVNLLQHIVKNKEALDAYDKLILVDVLQYGVQKIPKEILDHPKVEFIKNSIYISQVLDQIVRPGDAIIHLAVEENTFSNPQIKSSPNIEGYVRLMANKKVSRFIFISSANVYGHNHGSDNILETDELKPTTVYAANKMAFEAYIQAYYNLSGLPAVIFRPVTIYGPNQYPGWLVPRTITRVMKGEKIQLTDRGAIKRDWIHVDDICVAIQKALLSKRKDILGEAFNLGTGTEMSAIETVKYILHKLKASEDLIEYVDARPGDISREITRADKAREYFGWKSTIDFKSGLDSTIEWYRNNFDK